MVGNNLKLARNKLGLSQSDLAKSLGVHVVQYGNYERGINKPSCDILEKLASIHNININYLLTGKGAMFITPDLEKDLIKFKLPKNSKLLVEIEE